MKGRIVEVLRSVLCSGSGGRDTSPSVDLDTETFDRGESVDPALEGLPDYGEIYMRKPMDGKYRIPDREGFLAAVEADALEDREYRSDYFDCEDFTVALRATFAERYQCNAVGTVLTYDGAAHAFNVVFLRDGNGNVTAELFEPQSDEFVTGSGADKYSLDGAVIFA